MLEIMIALVLFAVGTIACMELIQRGQAASTDGENVLVATHLAKRRLEELRNIAYSSLADETKTSVTSPAGFTQFSREVDVTNLHSDTLRQLEVTVSWDAAGGTSDVTLQTYRSDTR